MSPAYMFMQECRLTIPVNGRREVSGEVGYYPSRSLPMRIRGAGTVKTDCFAPLVISAETYSGMFLSAPRLLGRPAPLLLDCGPAHIEGGLGGSGPKQWEQTAFSTSAPLFLVPFFKQQRCLFPGIPCIPTLQLQRGT